MVIWHWKFQFETSSRKYSLAFRSHGCVPFKLHSLISMHDSSSELNDWLSFISKPFFGSKVLTKKRVHFSRTVADLEIIYLGTQSWITFAFVFTESINASWFFRANSATITFINVLQINFYKNSFICQRILKVYQR